MDDEEIFFTILLIVAIYIVTWTYKEKNERG